jgi:hypothetical protein
MEDETGTKRNWRKEDRGLYLPGTTPVLVDVPEFPFFEIVGKGNPERPEFGAEVASLFALSFGVKMMPKKGTAPLGYYSFQVHPLEGVWDLPEAAQRRPLDRSALTYRLQMRQPDFVTEEVAQDVLRRTVAAGKLPVPPERVRLVHVREGRCVGVMHIGPFHREPESFAKIEAFLAGQGLVRTEGAHREIYLSDFRRENPETFRTVLRVRVEPDER